MVLGNRRTTALGTKEFPLEGLKTKFYLISSSIPDMCRHRKYRMFPTNICDVSNLTASYAQWLYFLVDSLTACVDVKVPRMHAMENPECFVSIILDRCKEKCFLYTLIVKVNISPKRGGCGWCQLSMFRRALT
jgi:hypothetical protein